VRAAIEAHDRAMEAQQQLRVELEAHPDILEFRFRALLPKIQKFDSAEPVVLNELPNIENRYREITQRMADYLARKQQLTGSQDYRIAAARNQISVALMQAPIATDRLHFRVQSIQNDFQINVVPLQNKVIDLEQLCRRFDEAESAQSGCELNSGTISEFERKFAELSKRLAQSEATYHSARKIQQQLMDASSRTP
jgi:hypothetical protein